MVGDGNNWTGMFPGKAPEPPVIVGSGAGDSVLNVLLGSNLESLTHQFHNLGLVSYL